MNWTTIISGAITAAINGIALFLATRYTARLVDRIERNGKKRDIPAGTRGLKKLGEMKNETTISSG